MTNYDFAALALVSRLAFLPFIDRDDGFAVRPLGEIDLGDLGPLGLVAGFGVRCIGVPSVLGFDPQPVRAGTVNSNARKDKAVRSMSISFERQALSHHC